MLAEEENRFRSRAIAFVKEGTFKFSLEVMWSNIWNEITYNIVLIYEFMTCLSFPFALCLDPQFDDNFWYGFDIFRQTQLDYYLDNISFLIIILYYLISVIMLCMLIVMVLLNEYLNRRAKSIRNEEKTNYFKLLNCIIIALSTALTVPVYTSYMLIFKCERGDNGDYILANSNDLQCFSTQYLIYMFISLFLILIFTFLHIFKEILLVDNDPISKIPWAGYHTSPIFISKLLSKITISAFSTVGYYEDTYIYAMIISILSLFATYYFIIKTPPFYHHSVNIIILFTQSFLLLLYILLFLQKLIDVQITFMGLILIFILTISFCIFNIYLKGYMNKSKCKKNISDLDKEEIGIYIPMLYLSLQDYINHPSTNNEKVICSYLRQHQATCSERNCKCAKYELINSKKQIVKLQNFVNQLGKNSLVGNSSVGNLNTSRSLFSQKPTSEDSDEDTDQHHMEENIKTITSYISEEMKLLRQTHSKDITILTFSAVFDYAFKENILSAISTLHYIKLFLKPSLQESFQNYSYIKKLEKKFIPEAAKRSELDSEKILQFENLYQIILEKTNSIANLGIQFWQNISSSNFDPEAIQLIGNQMNEELGLVEKKFEKAVLLNPIHYNIVREYGIFLIKIVHNHNEGEILQRRGRKLLRELNSLDETAYIDILNIAKNKNTCIVIASANPDSIGTILSCNNELYPNLGYQIKDVIGNNCSDLMPHFIGASHNHFIQHYIDTKYSKLQYQKKIVMGQDINGFLIPLRIYLLPLSCLESGVKFMAILRRLESGVRYFPERADIFNDQTFGVIATSSNKEIIGISEVCFRILGIPLSLVQYSSEQEKKVQKVPILDMFNQDSISSNSEHEIVGGEIHIERIIPDLYDPEVEEQVANEGREVLIDTRPLKLYSDNEALTQIEIDYLHKKTGITKVFMISRNELYCRGLVSVRLYKFFAIQPEEVEEVPTESPIMSRYSLRGFDDIFAGVTQNKTKNQYLEIAKDKEFEFLDDKEEYEEETTIDSVQSSEKEEIFQDEFLEFKKKVSQKNTNNPLFKFLNYFMAIIPLLLSSCALIACIFSLIQISNFYTGHEIVFNSAVRYFNQVFVSTNVENMKQMADLYSSPDGNPNYPNFDSYTYSRNFVDFIIDDIRETQTFIDSLDLDFPKYLYELEKTSSVLIVTLGRTRNRRTIPYTINSAISQFLVKASDLESYEYEQFESEYKLKYRKTEIPMELERAYYFVLENGAFELNKKLEASALEFYNLIEEKNQEHWNKILLCCAISMGCTVLILIISFPLLTKLHKEKYIILGLFAHMSKVKAMRMTRKCFRYQKTAGFIEKEKIEVMGSLMVKAEDIKQVDIDSKSSGEEKDPLSDLEDNEEFKAKEEEKARKQELERTEIGIREAIVKNMQINKTCLFCAIFLFSLIFILYFAFLLYLNDREITLANKANKSLFTIGDYFSSPLQANYYIILVVIYGNKYTRGTGEDEVYAIDYYIAKVLKNKEYLNELIYSDDSFLQNMQKKLIALDSDKYCESFVGTLGRYEEKYKGGYSFEGIKSMTLELCKTTHNRLLTQGLTQTIMTVYEQTRITQEHRMKTVLAGLEVDTNTVNITAVSDYWIFYTLFVYPVGGEMIQDLSKDYNSYLDSVKLLFVLWFCLCLFLVILFFLLAWPLYSHKVKISLRHANNLLTLVPDHIFYNAYVSKFHYKKKLLNEEIIP